MRASLLVLLVALGCGASPDSSDDAPATFTVEIVMQAPTKLSGCAIGDLLPGTPGNEIATVGTDGSIYVGRQDGDVWKFEAIAKTPGEMIQCAIGDADPTRPGLELVAVGIASGGEDDGGPGQAHLFYREAGAWKREMIFEDTALIHGVCIGDVDPQHEGNEVCTVGFSNAATIVARASDGTWKGTKAGDLGSPGKTVVPYRSGVAAACAAGAVVHFTRGDDGTWKRTVLDEAKAGQARIATDGSRVLVGRDDGGLGLIVDGARTDIHEETSKLRGAVLADLDPAADGLEAATAGYLGHITVLYPRGDGWSALRVFTDTNRYHHLTSGRVGTDDRVSLLAVNYSGRVVVIRRTRVE